MVLKLPLPDKLGVAGLTSVTETARQVINEYRGYYVDVWIRLEMKNNGATKDITATMREEITDIELDKTTITLQSGIITHAILRGHIQRIEQQAQTLVVFDKIIDELDYTLRIARYEMLRG